MKVAIIGATGLVGKCMIEMLESRNYPVSELIPAASEKSSGKHISFHGKSYPVILIEEALQQKPDIALFSAGADISHEYAPLFAAANCKVIDNSSAWRMHPDIKLIVPEVNAHVLTQSDLIIANPNCSTIQMVLPLKALHHAFGLGKVIVSTYQSVSGSGQSGLDQLSDESTGHTIHPSLYPHPIHQNLIPQIDDFCENGFTKEEMKMIQETQKIMELPKLQVNATAVRVPVLFGHSESVYVELLQKPESVHQVYECLASFPGVKWHENHYPMPKSHSDDDYVHIGRVRLDVSDPKALSFWIVSNNVRKGAATNALQIAELLLKNQWIK